MTISVGDKLPEVTLVKATAEGPQQISSGEYFAGPRRVHPDLFGQTPSWLCRKGRRIEGKGYRRNCRHRGQRRIRNGGLEQGSRIG